MALPKRIQEVADGQVTVAVLGGATEAAIWSNMYQIYPRVKLLPDGRANTASNMGEWNSIPYGQPLRNQTMYILDDTTMEHCEPWVTGMIYIGGVGVALGYFRDLERTARQFVQHPRTGERLFRTGDLGRLRPCGYLEILGRRPFPRTHPPPLLSPPLNHALCGWRDLCTHTRLPHAYAQVAKICR